jgi:hypothetical protein
MHASGTRPAPGALFGGSTALPSISRCASDDRQPFNFGTASRLIAASS